MVPSQKQNYASSEGTFLDQGWLTFFIRKKIQLLVMKQKNRQFLHKSKIGSLKKYFVTHYSVCNRIETTPNVIIISIIFRESWRSYQAFLSRSVLSIVFFTHGCCSTKTTVCETQYTRSINHWWRRKPVKGAVPVCSGTPIFVSMWGIDQCGIADGVSVVLVSVLVVCQGSWCCRHKKGSNHRGERTW